MKIVVSVLLAAGIHTVAAAELDLDRLCLDCHRPKQSRGEVPMIEGQQRDYLRHQLQRFRDRHRDSFPMTGLTAGLDEKMIESAAEGLSRRSWGVLPLVVSPDAVKRGRGRATARDCAACHGDQFLGTGDIPRLAGQHLGYLARQIEAFGRGERYHPPTGTGAPMRTIGIDEATDLAAYLHWIGTQQPEDWRDKRADTAGD